MVTLSGPADCTRRGARMNAPETGEVSPIAARALTGAAERDGQLHHVAVLGGRGRRVGAGGRRRGRGDVSAGGPVLRGARRAAARSLRPAVDDEPAHRGRLATGDGPPGGRVLRRVAAV